MPSSFVILGLLPGAAVAWMIATRHRRGVLETASRLVVLGASILAFEHAFFAITCSAKVGCTLPGTFFPGDHLRLHFFMAGVYTVVGAGGLIVIARTLLREGRRSGWYSVLAALAIGGSLELVLGNVWFSHALAEDVTPGTETFEDLAFLILYTYLVAWSAALVMSFRAVFRPAGNLSNSLPQP